MTVIMCSQYNPVLQKCISINYLIYVRNKIPNVEHVSTVIICDFVTQ